MRFFDDLLRAETERLDQVVLLGAGFDTAPSDSACRL
jgi:O-methyltransferase involved in polyketide biosynthesis